MRRRLARALAVVAIAAAGLLAAPANEAQADVHAYSASIACGLVGSVPLLGGLAGQLCDVTGGAVGSGIEALNSVTGLHLPTSLGGAVGSLAQAGANTVLNGVSGWIASGAVWLMSRVANLIQTTTHPQLTSGWFAARYKTMADLALWLALPLLILAVMRALWSRDLGELFRSALLYLPLAAILTAAAVVVTQMGIDITDGMAATVSKSVGGDAHQFLTGATKGMIVIGAGSAAAGAPALPGFVVAIGAVVAAIGAFVLWIELVLREAAIYVAVIFMPLSFVALIWPATARIPRRTVEALVAIVLSKFVIVAIIALAASGLVHSGLGDSFSAALAGIALILLACFAPVALLKMLPLMEAAVTHHGHTRAALAGGPRRAMNAHDMMRGAMRSHQSDRASGGGLSGAAGGGIRPIGSGGGGGAASAGAAGAGVGLAVAGAAAAGNAVANRASNGGAAAATGNGAAAGGAGAAGAVRGVTSAAAGSGSRVVADGAGAGDSAVPGASSDSSSAATTRSEPEMGEGQGAGAAGAALNTQPPELGGMASGTAPAAAETGERNDASAAPAPSADAQALGGGAAASPLDPPVPVAGAPATSGPQAPAELHADGGNHAMAAGMSPKAAPTAGPPFDAPAPAPPARDGSAPGVVRPPARPAPKQPLPPEQLIPEEGNDG